jgi:type IV secretion system protein VirB6
MAACQPITTGPRFIETTLAHLDCQARVLGYGGWSNVSDFASGPSGLIVSALTLGIAFFAVRMMVARGDFAVDGLALFLRIALVLTIATSWPAYRMVFYNVIISGPTEMASAINTGAQNPNAGLASRLSRVDQAIGDLTASGTGRLSAALQTAEGVGKAEEFERVAMGDETGFAFGKMAFLLSVIVPAAFLRLLAGILLALGPIFALFLLFRPLSGLFFGWARALLFLAIASAAQVVLFSVMLAGFEPYLANAAALRSGGYITPALPTELTALAVMFFILSLGLFWLFGRMAFHQAMPVVQSALQDAHAWLAAPRVTGETVSATQNAALPSAHLRSDEQIEMVRQSAMRERLITQLRDNNEGGGAPSSLQAGGGEGIGAPASHRLADSWRRTSPRRTRTAMQRETVS